MTSNATILRTRATRHVLRVIEFDVEALFEIIGKSFARWIVAIDVLMTNRTHRNIRRGELRQVTAGAILMSGEAGPRGVVRSMMAVRAAE